MSSLASAALEGRVVELRAAIDEHLAVSAEGGVEGAGRGEADRGVVGVAAARGVGVPAEHDLAVLLDQQLVGRTAALDRSGHHAVGAEGGVEDTGRREAGRGEGAGVGAAEHDLAVGLDGQVAQAVEGAQLGRGNLGLAVTAEGGVDGSGGRVEGEDRPLVGPVAAVVLRQADEGAGALDDDATDPVVVAEAHLDDAVAAAEGGVGLTGRGELDDVDVRVVGVGGGAVAHEQAAGAGRSDVPHPLEAGDGVELLHAVVAVGRVERAGGGVAGDVGAGLLHRAVLVRAVAGHDELGVELQEARSGVLRAGDAGLHAVTGELRVEVPRCGTRRRCAEEADREGGGRGRDADPAAERPVGGGAGGEHRRCLSWVRNEFAREGLCCWGHHAGAPLGVTWRPLALRMERVEALVRTGPAGLRARRGRPGRARIRPGSTPLGRPRPVRRPACRRAARPGRRGSWPGASPRGT